MPFRRWPLAVAVWLAAAPATAGAPPASAPSGTILGRVRYVGRVPPPLIVFEAGGDAEQKVLHVDPSTQGLRFAVAYVDAPAETDATDAPRVTIDQVGWMFQPPVVAVREAQAVRFTNGDGANHNVRANDGVPENRFDEMTSTASYNHRFRAPADPGRPIAVTCGLHAWMIAWVYVFPHRHHAVSDESGRFELGPLPAGPYRLHVRQPAGGLARDLDVRVAGGRTEIEVVFDTADLRPWKPDWPSQREP